MRKVVNIGLLLGVLLLYEGCASFETNVGKTVKGTAETVEQGRQGWVAYVQNQRVMIPNAADRQDLERAVQKVGEAYAKYQSAMRAANLALTVYHNTPEAQRNQEPVKLALQALLAASGEIVQLVGTLTK